MTVPGFAVPWKGVCWPEWNQRQQRLRASGDSTEAGQKRERERSPNPAKSVVPAWLFAAKMVPAGEKAARGTVLRERAFDRSIRQVSYSSRRDFLPGSRQYLERMQQIGYSARLLLNLGNWNEVRDGGWLQIQPPTSNI